MLKYVDPTPDTLTRVRVSDVHLEWDSEPVIHTATIYATRHREYIAILVGDDAYLMYPAVKPVPLNSSDFRARILASEYVFVALDPEWIGNKSYNARIGRVPVELIPESWLPRPEKAS